MNYTEISELVDRIGLDITDLPKDLEDLYRYFGLEATPNLRLEDLLSHLRRQTLSALGASAHTEISTLQRQLVYEHVLNNKPLQPLGAVLAHLKDRTLIERPDAPGSTDWVTAVKFALYMQQISPHFSTINTGPTQGLFRRLMTREFNVAESAVRLNKHNISVVARNGEIMITHQDKEKIATKLLGMIRRTGGIRLLSLIFDTITKFFDPEMRRYHLIRGVSHPVRERPPRHPYGYLLQLAVREANVKGEQLAETATICNEIVQLATDLVTVMDVESYSTLDRAIASPHDLVSFLVRTAIYDSCFTLTQMDPLHVEYCVLQLFSPFTSDECISAWGGTLDTVTKVIRSIILLANSTGPTHINIPSVAKHASVPENGVRVICSKLSHEKGRANADFLLPTDFEKCDFLFRPLISLGEDDFLLADTSWCAPAFIEALMDAMRVGGIEEPDTRIGYEGMEGLLRDAIGRRGISVAHGNHDQKPNAPESDATIATQDNIFFLEAKKKALSRASRSGNPFSLVADEADSLIHAHNQCLRHELKIRRDNEICLNKKNGRPVKIPLNSRSVERVAVTLTDHLTFHDRHTAQYLLSAAFTVDFTTHSDEDMDLQRLSKFQGRQRKLRKLVTELAKLDLQSKDQPFFRTSFMSVGQLLTILEDVEDVASFQTAMTQTRHVTMGTGDFLYEYRCMKDLRRQPKSSQS
ncbi:MAG: hypothetical protein AAGF11_10255 [Myxococcota bacterium]